MVSARQSLHKATFILDTVSSRFWQQPKQVCWILSSRQSPLNKVAAQNWTWREDLGLSCRVGQNSFNVLSLYAIAACERHACLMSTSSTNLPMLSSKLCSPPGAARARWLLINPWWSAGKKCQVFDAIACILCAAHIVCRYSQSLERNICSAFMLAPHSSVSNNRTSLWNAQTSAGTVVNFFNISAMVSAFLFSVIWIIGLSAWKPRTPTTGECLHCPPDRA